VTSVVVRGDGRRAGGPLHRTYPRDRGGVAGEIAVDDPPVPRRSHRRRRYELALSLTPGLLRRFRDELAAKVKRVSASNSSSRRRLGRRTRMSSITWRSRPSPPRAPGITTPISPPSATASTLGVRHAGRAPRRPRAVRRHLQPLRARFLVSGFFGTVLWTTAETLAADGDARPFPRRYASIRRAVRTFASSRAKRSTRLSRGATSRQAIR